jgi:hypothetical protein
MSPRQIKVYTNTCDLYRPNDLSDSRIGNDILTLSHDATPAYTNVKYFHESNPEMEKGKFFGRINREDTPALIDKCHFADDQEVGSNWILVNKDSGMDYYQDSFIMTGDALQKSHRAKKKAFYAKRITRGNTI